MKPTYRIVIVAISLALLSLLWVLFSDISTPVARKGHFFTTEKASFGMMLCICIVFILGGIIGLGAMSEKVLTESSVLWATSVWLYMIAIQYCRVVHHKGLFDGFMFSIIKWTGTFLVIHIVSYFFLSKIDKRRREREQEEKWKENIKKVGIQYVYIFDDGSEITVTQEDMLLDEKKDD